MKHEKTIEREDGTVIRLVATYFPNIFGTPAIEFFALVQTKDSDESVLFTQSYEEDKSLHGMSVDEYIDHGRKGVLAVVQPHELIKAGMELKEKLRAA